MKRERLGKGLVRRCACAVALLLMVCGLAACWDRREVDEIAIVLTMAIDAGEEPDSLLVSYEIIDPGGITSGQQDQHATAGGGGSYVISAPGRTVRDAGQQLQRRQSREIYLAQLRGVILGERLARAGVAAVLDFLERHPELRRTIWIGVAHGEAREVLRARPTIDNVSGIAFSRLMGVLPSAGSFSVLLGDFLELLAEPGGAPVAPALATAEAGLRAEAKGMGVFLGDRLVGFLDAWETLGLGLARGEISRGTVILVKDPERTEDRPVAFQVQTNAASTDVELEDGRVRATIHVQVEGRLVEAMGGVDFTGRVQWPQLEQLQADAARQAVEAAVRRAQEWKTDIFGIGLLMARRYPRQWSAMGERWPQLFSEADISVVVHSRLTQTGISRERLPIRSGRETP